MTSRWETPRAAAAVGAAPAPRREPSRTRTDRTGRSQPPRGVGSAKAAGRPSAAASRAYRPRTRAAHRPPSTPVEAGAASGDEPPGATTPSPARAHPRGGAKARNPDRAHEATTPPLPCRARTPRRRRRGRGPEMDTGPGRHHRGPGGPPRSGGREHAMCDLAAATHRSETPGEPPRVAPLPLAHPRAAATVGAALAPCRGPSRAWVLTGVHPPSPGPGAAQGLGGQTPSPPEPTGRARERHDGFRAAPPRPWPQAETGPGLTPETNPATSLSANRPPHGLPELISDCDSRPLAALRRAGGVLLLRLGLGTGLGM